MARFSHGDVPQVGSGQPGPHTPRVRGGAADAVVIGAGHNGLVAAAMLADAGWDVLVLEAQPEPGGAVRSAMFTEGYVTDLFSAFYPMAAVSPALRDLHLEDHGLRWSHAPAVVAHPRGPGDDAPPVIHHDPAATAAALDAAHPGDGGRWLDAFALWQRLKPGLLQTLFAPLPPLRGPLALLRTLGAAETLRTLRLLLLPATAMGEQLFGGDAARLLLLGNAMHADIPVDAPGSGVMGFLLTMLAQDTGWPVPVGGAGRLTAALVDRARSAGVSIECGREVAGIDVRGGRAVAVRTADGRTVRARRAVIADTSAPALFGRLLPPDALPSGLLREMTHFVWDTPVVKVNYAVEQQIPWRCARLADVGTIHLGADAPGLIRWMADLNTATVPDNPFLLMGQMTTADPTRSPAGTQSAWAYSHLPRRITDTASAERLAAAIDRVIDSYAPGFTDAVVDRTVQRPGDLQTADDNLYAGAVNGGTSQLFQQLIFRPAAGLGRPHTPVDGLYLGSAAIHPGGSVHGVCGRNAARAALAAQGIRGWPRRRLNRAVTALLTR